VFQNVKMWYKRGRNMRKVGERRANKLEKVFEKCESFDGKMGCLARTLRVGTLGEVSPVELSFETVQARQTDGG
jgi:hypothetical protein